MTLPTPWHVPASLTVLREQIDTAWPNRSKASDGTVADRHHTIASDHWPHLVPALGPDFWVTAEDITHDPTHGVWTDLIADAIRESRDPRVKYIISFGRIASNPASSHAADDWAWRPYDGADPHTNHMHASVLDSALSGMRTPWAITATLHSGRKDNDMLFKIASTGSLVGAPPNTSRGTIYAATPSGPVGITGEEWASIGNPAPMVVSSWSRLLQLTAPPIPAVSEPGVDPTPFDVRAVIREEMDSTLTRAHFRIDPAL